MERQLETLPSSNLHVRLRALKEKIHQSCPVGCIRSRERHREPGQEKPGGLHPVTWTTPRTGPGEEMNRGGCGVQPRPSRAFSPKPWLFLSCFVSCSKPTCDAIDSPLSNVTYHPAAWALFLTPSHPLPPSGDAEGVCPTCLPRCWSASWTGGVPQCKEIIFFLYLPISLETLSKRKNNQKTLNDHVTLCCHVTLTDCRQTSYLF